MQVRFRFAQREILNPKPEARKGFRVVPCIPMVNSRIIQISCFELRISRAADVPAGNSLYLTPANMENSKQLSEERCWCPASLLEKPTKQGESIADWNLS